MSAPPPNLDSHLIRVPFETLKRSAKDRKGIVDEITQISESVFTDPSRSISATTSGGVSGRGDPMQTDQESQAPVAETASASGTRITVAAEEAGSSHGCGDAMDTDEGPTATPGARRLRATPSPYLPHTFLANVHAAPSP